MSTRWQKEITKEGVTSTGLRHKRAKPFDPNENSSQPGKTGQITDRTAQNVLALLHILAFVLLIVYLL